MPRRPRLRTRIPRRPRLRPRMPRRLPTHTSLVIVCTPHGRMPCTRHRFSRGENLMTAQRSTASTSAMTTKTNTSNTLKRVNWSPCQKMHWQKDKRARAWYLGKKFSYPGDRKLPGGTFVIKEVGKGKQQNHYKCEKIDGGRRKRKEYVYFTIAFCMFRFYKNSGV